MIMYLPKEQKWEGRKYHDRGFFVAGVEFLCSSKLTFIDVVHTPRISGNILYIIKGLLILGIIRATFMYIYIY